nr:hypothetical protein [Tanacetum cinerariifolium]
EIEYDQLTEAQQVSLAKAVSTKEAGEKENVAGVEKDILPDEVKQMVEGEEEDESEFLDSLLISQ